MYSLVELFYERPIYKRTIIFYQLTMDVAKLYKWYFVTKIVLSFTNLTEMVFCYQNCSYLIKEKIVLAIEKNF